MKPKNNKLTLIMAIILTIIALPLAILSTYGHVLYPNSKDKDTCDLKLVDGSCYTCENKTGYCDYAYNYVGDSLYALNYYKGNNNYLTAGANNQYAFLMDTPTTFNYANLNEHPKTIIYNKSSGSKINVTGLNNYGIGINGDYYIGVTDTGKYTVFYINQTVRKVLTEEYDFIGLANHITDGKLDSTAFVVLRNNEWLLIDAEDNILSTTFTNPIYDFSTRAIALYKDNSYYLSDYQGNNLLNMYFDKVYFYKDILLLINNNTLYIYDSATDTVLSSSIKVNKPDDVSVEESDEYFDVLISGISNVRVYYDGRIADVSDEADSNGDDTNLDDNTNNDSNLDNSDSINQDNTNKDSQNQDSTSNDINY